VLTAERVRALFDGVVRGDVQRYALPHLGALHFVMHEALAGGVTRSLALDAHGKTLASAVLDIEVEPPLLNLSDPTIDAVPPITTKETLPCCPC
jgi:hypothetical protein